MDESETWKKNAVTFIKILDIPIMFVLFIYLLFWLLCFLCLTSLVNETGSWFLHRGWAKIMFIIVLLHSWNLSHVKNKPVIFRHLGVLWFIHIGLRWINHILPRCLQICLKWGLPRCKSLWSFSLFCHYYVRSILCFDFFVFFVLRHSCRW